MLAFIKFSIGESPRPLAHLGHCQQVLETESPVPGATPSFLGGPVWCSVPCTLDEAVWPYPLPSAGHGVERHQVHEFILRSSRDSGAQQGGLTVCSHGLGAGGGSGGEWYPVASGICSLTVCRIVPGFQEHSRCRVCGIELDKHRLSLCCLVCYMSTHNMRGTEPEHTLLLSPPSWQPRQE